MTTLIPCQKISPSEEGIAREFCNWVDWENPGLQQTDALRFFKQGDFYNSAVDVMRYLRERDTPNPGYTREYMLSLRSSASDGLRQAARKRWEAVIARDVKHSLHNPFTVIGAETILIGATPDLCRRTIRWIVDFYNGWETHYWGVTPSICEFLRYLWPLDECENADLIPLFVILLNRASDEWKGAREWDETLLSISGHNWWLHHYCGFWMLGFLFPEFRGMARFAALSPGFLERELPILFEEDGWIKEGSPGYQMFSANSLMHFICIGERNGTVFSESILRRVRAIACNGWRLLTPDGDFPLFHDFVRAGMYTGYEEQGRPDNRPCALLRRYAARFSSPESKYVAEALDPGWEPFYGVLSDEGEDLLGAYRRLAPLAPESVDTSLPQSGFYMMRQNWSGQSDYLGISAGVVGPRITSHKHADIFNFELYSRGRRILVDNGYGPLAHARSDDKTRMWRKSSGAHNVATVDEYDHVQVIDEFNFGAPVLPVVDDWRSDSDHAYFSGVHEGYLRLPEKVSAARRKVFYLRGKYWIIIDRFTAATPAAHKYQLHFHLLPPAVLHENGRVVTRGNGGNLLIIPVGNEGMGAVLEPNPHPIESPGYENPWHLCYTCDASGSMSFITLLVPFGGVATPDVQVSIVDVKSDERILSPFEATCLRIKFEESSHFYFDQHQSWNLPWEADGHSGHTRLFHSECGTLANGCPTSISEDHLR